MHEWNNGWMDRMGWARTSFYVYIVFICSLTLLRHYELHIGTVGRNNVAIDIYDFENRYTHSMI